MNLKEITMVKLEDFKGKADWRADLYDESVYLFISEEKVIAEAVLFNGINHIIVDNMEVRFKRKGTGAHITKMISDYAREKGKCGISGESVYDALNFWRYMNAEFKFREDDPCMACFDDERECVGCENLNLNELTPFEIKCDEVDGAFKKWVILHS